MGQQDQREVVNALLKALPRKTLQRVRRECELVELSRGDVLGEPGERIRHAYFPVGAFISLVAKSEGNASLEVALVGDEGMVGIPLILGVDTERLRVVVQGSGKAWRMKAVSFQRVQAANLQLQRRLSIYVTSRLAQLAQNAACSRFHLLEARLARRLLMTQDRAHSDHFHITQEVLAEMLGVRRSGITCAAIPLQRKELIRYHRGDMTVLDRPGLESIACECYQSARHETESLTG